VTWFLKRFKAQGIQKFPPHDLKRTCSTGLSNLKTLAHFASGLLTTFDPEPGPDDFGAYIDEKR